MENIENNKMSLSELSKEFRKAIKQIEEDQEKYWSSLTSEQQIDVFCCIARRIHKGEIQDKGSYRHVLYDVFGWGPEAYAVAQCAGYLDIHNSIVAEDHDYKLIKIFCEKNGIEIKDEKIDDFLEGNFVP